MTTCVGSSDMNLMGHVGKSTKRVMVYLPTWHIRCISHERTQVVNQNLYLHFLTHSM